MHDEANASESNHHTNNRVVTSREGRDRIMTVDEFKKWKRELLPQIREPGDPPPRLIRPGSGCQTAYFKNLRELLASDKSAKLVRGYKMYQVPLVDEQWKNKHAWKAVSAAVVSFPVTKSAATENGDASQRRTVMYRCATKCDSENAYVFVPSSRANAELSDDQYVSGMWILGCIIGGNETFCRLVMFDQNLRGQRKSVIHRVPEQLVAKRAIKTFLLPWFKSWYETRMPNESIDALAEIMGFPVSDIDENLDMTHAKSLRKGVDANAASLVNGYKTIDLQLKWCKHLHHNETTPKKVRDVFFKHYDALYKTVETVIQQRLAEEAHAIGAETKTET